MNKRNIYIALIIFGILFLVSVMLSSCYSLKGTSIPPDVNSFSVGFFENKAAQVNTKLSQTITEKLKDKLNNTRLNFTRENGDFSFNGSITGYTINPVTVQQDASATKNRLTITLEVKFVCVKHPELNFEQSFTNFQDYDASKNFTTLENNMVADITDQLIQEIFNKAVVNW